MRHDVSQAERRHEVRLAALSWLDAGIIGSETLQAILESYPDDRSRVGAAFRVLLFLFTGVAVVSGFTLLAVNDVPLGLLLLPAALGNLVLTEIQTGKLRRARTGSEEATAILAVLFAVAWTLWLLDWRVSSEWRFVLFGAVAASIAAAWRWGLPAFGALAAASAFAMLSSWPGARLSWIVLGALLSPALVQASVSKRLAPSQRRAAAAALVTVLLAVYIAIHLGSYDQRLLEDYRGAPEGLGRGFFIAATVMLPVALLAAGVALRRPLLLRMGLLFAVASLVTLRFYVHVAPLWLVLVGAGGALVALAMGIHRFLSSGPGRERRGFTSDSILDRPESAALELGMAAALGPEPSPHPEKGFRGGGGEFGGGGASGSY